MNAPESALLNATNEADAISEAEAEEIQDARRELARHVVARQVARRNELVSANRKARFAIGAGAVLAFTSLADARVLHPSHPELLTFTSIASVQS